MLPREFDLMSFREILLVIRATDDEQKEAWRRAATVSSFVYNYGSPRKRGFMLKQPADLFPRLYGRTIKNFEKKFAAALEQEALYMAQLEKKEARLRREALERQKEAEKKRARTRRK